MGGLLGADTEVWSVAGSSPGHNLSDEADVLTSEGVALWHPEQLHRPDELGTQDVQRVVDGPLAWAEDADPR